MAIKSERTRALEDTLTKLLNEIELDVLDSELSSALKKSQ